MKTPSTRGLLTIPFAIPAYWTPEQALAVVELIEDLRDRSWARYAVQLHDQHRELYRDHYPPGPFAIPAHWTPVEALAVIELLEDLRDKVWSHYAAQLYAEYREQRCHHSESPEVPEDPDALPF